MKTLKRSECSVLPLVLKRRWFEMIQSGKKREEYRADTDYWWTRIENWSKRGPRVVEFRLGYQRNAPRMAFTAGPVFTPEDKPEFQYPEWGQPDTPHFVITLDERVELED